MNSKKNRCTNYNYLVKNYWQGNYAHEFIFNHPYLWMYGETPLKMY